MRLSRAMREQLLFMAKYGDPSGKVRHLRPIHYLNRVTHRALVRRGLFAEKLDGDQVYYTILTDKGREVAQSL